MRVSEFRLDIRQIVGLLSRLGTQVGVWVPEGVSVRANPGSQDTSSPHRATHATPRRNLENHDLKQAICPNLTAPRATGRSRHFGQNRRGRRCLPVLGTAALDRRRAPHRDLGEAGWVIAAGRDGSDLSDQHELVSYTRGSWRATRWRVNGTSRPGRCHGRPRARSRSRRSKNGRARMRTRSLCTSVSGVRGEAAVPLPDGRVVRPATSRRVSDESRHSIPPFAI